MGKGSKIEWTHHTFNPWWGCQKVSPGCANCYAETFARRFDMALWGPTETAPRRFFGDAHWAKPLRWNAEAARTGQRRRVFCASMADVFEDRPDLAPHRARLFDLISKTPLLDWLLLTKRPEHINDMVPWHGERGNYYGWPDNVWIGTSVETQEQADARIPRLLKVPARVRFLSCEPLLGPVVLQGTAPYGTDSVPWVRKFLYSVSPIDDQRIHWVIVGGESGPKARSMHPQWARSLRDQCEAAGVPLFFKQWGEWVSEGATPVGIPPGSIGPERCRWLGCDGSARPVGEMRMRESDVLACRVGKAAAGRMLDGRTWDEVPT